MGHLTGEIVAAHPANVAAADQIQAAAPRRAPSVVILRDHLPADRVFVVNLDAMHEQLYGESLWRTLRRARLARAGLRDPLDEGEGRGR